MPQRKCTKERTEIVKPLKRITLPIEMATYQTLVFDPVAFRQWLDEMIAQYPALFPPAIQQGYTLHDRRTSVKLPAVSLRRIKLCAPPDGQQRAQVFTIAPSGVLPYLTGYTDEVEKALFLRSFSVPYWALAHVFGRDEQSWFRQTSHLGRFEIVATTVQAAEKLPPYLLADEKHVAWNGEKAYLATTVGQDCVLGVSLALAADEPALTAALVEALFGQVRAHHRFMLQETLHHIDELNARIASLNQRIQALVAPHEGTMTRLMAIPGVGRRTAEILLAEIGHEVAQFPSAKQLASWACLCPGNHISASKRRSGKTRKGQKWLNAALTEAAWAASHTKDTYRAAQFHRLRARRGAKRAAVAVAHSIITIVYHLLKDPQATFQELGGDFFIKRNKVQQQRWAVRTLETLGFQVSLAPLAT